MELGGFSLTDIQGSARGGPAPTPAQRLNDIIGYGVLADRLGLDAFGIGAHHSLAFAVSSPAVALDAEAEISHEPGCGIALRRIPRRLADIARLPSAPRSFR